ncbi:unnamed protein product [Arabis nemorensis]|uniref:Uncharacterized protein n=1 Tax=Arabis nemorensis TaxID=586526 RepID=A0A565C100_9BRAS|nr:unnamed protein product [Arabis nemorensis]
MWRSCMQKRATAKEREENREKNIKEEAQRLNDDSDGGRREVDDRDFENGWMKGKRQILELENLAFDQGGFLRENKKCKLPPIYV